MKPWKEIEREQIFRKYGRGVDKVTFALPDGSHHDYYIKNEAQVAAVVALTQDQHVLLVRQYRPGPHKILLELPGGGIDADEKPEDAIARELLEETGYTGEISFVAISYDDGYSNLVRHCFVATNCSKQQEPSPEATEFLEVITATLDEFRAVLRSGQMTDVEVGYLGLDYLNLL